MPAVRMPARSRALAARIITLATVAATTAVLIGQANAGERTTLGISPRSGSQHYGQAFTMAARLVSGSSYVAGRVVTFYYKDSSRDPHWHVLHTARTNSHGVAAIPQRLSKGRIYYAGFSGDAAYEASSSSASWISVSSVGQGVVQEASRHNGAPYQYGAAGPRTFDCSGFTLYVWRRFGHSLPHNSQAQYQMRGMQHVPTSAKQPGDFIFMHSSSGSIYHVGIYAGNGRFWAATHSGDYVRLESIYSPSYYVGRITS